MSTPDDRLWMLDLDERGRPNLAHQVAVDSVPPPEAWPPELFTVCGLKITRSSSFNKGYWSTQPGNLPLPERDIHCRADVA